MESLNRLRKSTLQAELKDQRSPVKGGGDYIAHLHRVSAAVCAARARLHKKIYEPVEVRREGVREVRKEGVTDKTGGCERERRV